NRWWIQEGYKIQENSPREHVLNNYKQFSSTVVQGKGSYASSYKACTVCPNCSHYIECFYVFPHYDL
ncbi:hypothetical protein J6590_103582, partial [Homalodisca vitripennis]